ncbi:MAG: hypothetical protein ABSD74_05640 [Rhizomicrobium sp.]|jgi:hypothetical protein
MAANDLTNLADIKAWLGRTDSNSDSLLSALITRASRQIYSHLQRGLILPRAVDEVRNGSGGDTLMLKEWPVISVTSLVIGHLAVPQAASASTFAQPASGPGWTCEIWDGTPPGRPQALYLRGYTFGRSFPGAANTQNVFVSYQAGYQVSAEPQIVSGSMVTVNAPFGYWATNEGVTYATGAPLEQVSGSPAMGQYQLGSTAGVYNFNAGDDGATVLVSYGFIPSDLADACIELVAERYKYSERVGERSHSLGGNETVSFDTGRFTPLIAAMLEPYRNVAPF